MNKVYLLIVLSFFKTTLPAQIIFDLQFAKAVRSQCPTCLNEQNELEEPAKKLVSLNLCFKQIKDLSGIEGFSELETLDCSNNLLTILPFMPNPSLKQLRCANNRLTSLPFLPESLLFLDCSGNKINFSVGLPPALQRLVINGNAFKDLPILPTNLLLLSCTANQIQSITSFPDEITHINMAYNQLRKIPELPSSLTKLNVDHNRLDSLPSLPYQLKECSAIANNLKKIPVLPDVIQVLNVNNNKIDSLPYLTSRLVSLSFANNYVPNVLSWPASLKEIDCRNNLFIDLGKLPRRLTKLKMKGNNVTCLYNIPEKLKSIDDSTKRKCFRSDLGSIEQEATNDKPKPMFQTKLLTATASQLVPYRKGKKWGFLNTQGEIHDMPRFDGATLFEKNPNFSYSFSIVTLDNLKGIIDIEGEYVVEPNYAEIHSLSRNGFIARRPEISTWIYITEDGLAEEEFPEAITNDRVFKRYVKDKAYIASKSVTEMSEKTNIDTSNQQIEKVIPPQYDEVKYLSPISYDTVLAKKDGKWGIISGKNTVIVDFLYDDIKNEIFTIKNQYGTTASYITAKKNEKWGVRSLRDTSLILDYAFDEVKIHKIQPLNALNQDSNRLFLTIKKDNKWGLMAEKRWTMVLPIEYDGIELDEETENGFQLLKGKEMGYFIIPIEKTIPIKYKEVKYFKNGFAEVVTQNDTTGFVNENGDEYFWD
jgi:WG containing repeat